jgi:flagellin
MKELAAQSASANSGDRTQLQAEFATLSTEIDRITGTTDYQGNKLINGTMGNTASGTLLSAAPVGLDVASFKLNGAQASAGLTFAESVAGKLTLSDATHSQTVDVVACER